MNNFFKSIEQVISINVEHNFALFEFYLSFLAKSMEMVKSYACSRKGGIGSDFRFLLNLKMDVRNMWLRENVGFQPKSKVRPSK